MAIWKVYQKKADFDEIAQAYGISPIMARILRNRDIVGDESLKTFLYGTEKDLRDPVILPDADKAVLILAEKIRNGKKICIVGDYDVDGICAAHILYEGLTACGAAAEVILPDRLVDGYGLNQRMVLEAAAGGADTILTCDNGIAATVPIKAAIQLGMTVIVTDHHEPVLEEREGRTVQVLPPAQAVVDPKIIRPGREKPDYPFPEICGAVVAYKLIQLLLEGMRLPGRKERLAALLPFAAWATVCDVMPLTDENRIIVRQGLKEFDRTDNEGLKALVEVTDLKGRELSAYHLGFILGPCLNASGRLDHAIRAYYLFGIDNRTEALAAAKELKELNDSRKLMTVKGVEIAEQAIAGGHLLENNVLVVYLPTTHESLAGIIAGRLREKYGCPTFVMTDAEDGRIKGSGRSIEAYDMYRELSNLKDLFIRFGGHKMAAGLTMEKKNLPLFIREINARCTLREEDLEEVLHIDMEMPPRMFTLETVREFSLLEPTGKGNAKPMFAARDLEIESIRVMGKKQNVMRLNVRDRDKSGLEFLYFAQPSALKSILDSEYGEGCFDMLEKAGRPYAPEKLSGQETSGKIRIKAAYYPEINEWNGQERLQFVIRDVKI